MDSHDILPLQVQPPLSYLSSSLTTLTQYRQFDHHNDNDHVGDRGDELTEKVFAIFVNAV